MNTQFYLELNIEPYLSVPGVHGLIGPFDTFDEARDHRSNYGPPQSEVVEASEVSDQPGTDRMTPVEHIEYMRDRY